MSFLAPLSFALAGLIPVVVLLYFLKLKRRDEVVSSTYLWKRAVEDLRVNSPFQRLRKNLLLWLQVALLALLVLALARPMLRRGTREGRRLICLIDTSASMAARDVRPSRLDEAKAQVLRLIDGLGRDDQMMVMTFDAQATAPLTSDKARLREGVRALQQRETGTDPAPAFQVVRALVRDLPGAQVYLVSDGGFDPAAMKDAPEKGLTYLRVGRSSENLGLVALDARRSAENWDAAQIFARVRNSGAAAADARIELHLGDRLIDARNLSVPGGKSATAVFADPGIKSGLIRASLVPSTGAAGDAAADHLAVDNQAWLALAEPRPIRVLVVTAGNFFLDLAIRKDPLSAPLALTPEKYEADLKAGTLLVKDFDVVLFDRYAPAALAPGSYIFVGAVPPLKDFRADGEVTDPLIIDWDTMHPVNQYVSYQDLFLAKALKLAVPADAHTVVEGETGPLIAWWTSPTHRVLLVGFDLFDSRWPLRPAFPIFLANAVRYLGGVELEGGATRLAPGRAVTFAAPPNVSEVTVTRPDGTTAAVPVHGGQVTFGETANCGPYTFRVSDDRVDTFVVNLLDARESDITPRAADDWERKPETVQGEVVRQNRDLWPYLALAALALLIIEWYVYNRRVCL